MKFSFYPYTVIPPSQSNQAGMKLFFISLAILASQSVFGLQEASGNGRDDLNLTVKNFGPNYIIF